MLRTIRVHGWQLLALIFNACSLWLPAMNKNSWDWRCAYHIRAVVVMVIVVSSLPACLHDESVLIVPITAAVLHLLSPLPKLCCLTISSAVYWRNSTIFAIVFMSSLPFSMKAFIQHELLTRRSETKSDAVSRLRDPHGKACFCCWAVVARDAIKRYF